MIGIAALAWVLRGFDFSRFGAVIAKASIPMILFVPVIVIVEQVIRGWKWRLLGLVSGQDHPGLERRLGVVGRKERRLMRRFAAHTATGKIGTPSIQPSSGAQAEGDWL